MKSNTIYWEYMSVNLLLLKKKPEKLKVTMSNPLYSHDWQNLTRTVSSAL